MREGLGAARRNDCHSVTFVGLDVRLPRCRAFCEKVVQEASGAYDALEVNFLAAEDVIGWVAREKNRLPQWERILSEFRASNGYKRTLEAEQGGIQALKSGTYGQSLGGTNKT